MPLLFDITGDASEPAPASSLNLERNDPMWKLRYVAKATQLLLQGKIRWVIYRKALREWPIAVAGKGGSYQLDPDFPDGPQFS